MTDFEIQAELDRKLDAHMALAEKKDDLWDICQKYIDRNGVVDEHIADAVANHPDLLFSDNRAGEFLRGIAQLVGYAHPEVLLAKIEQQEVDEALFA
jgi:hypothetical protein